MDAAEDGGQQAVAGHGEPDAGLTKLEDEDGGDHAEDGSDEDEEADPLQGACAGHQGEALESVDDRGGVSHDRLPGNDAAEHDGNRAVEDGTSDEGGEDAEGQVTLRVFALLGGGGDGIEADVGEEDDGAASEDAGPAIGHEGVPVVGLDEAGSGKDEDQNGGHLDEDHDVVGACRFADAADQDHGENHDDEEGGDVEAEVPAGFVEVVAGEVLQSGGEISGRDPFGGRIDAEPVEEIYDVSGKADTDTHVAEGVFENQIPADDPGDEFAERGVGVGVGRAGNGNHGGQFGVTKAGEDADDGYENEREREGRTGAGAAGERGVEEEVVEERRIADGRRVEFLSGHGGADDREDARADDGADAERGE